MKIYQDKQNNQLSNKKLKKNYLKTLHTNYVKYELSKI